jgi:phenylacetate-CoA ligase
LACYIVGFPATAAGEAIVRPAGDRDPGQPFWDPEAQTRDPGERRARQDAGVREVVRRSLETPVPFFRRKLAEAGIASPDDVKGVDDLGGIPLTVKQELRDAEASALPYGDYRFTDVRACVRLGQSTGTTGRPTLMMWTARDLHIEHESGARNFWRHGLRPGMIVTHAHPAYLYGGGLLLSGVYEYMGLVNLWVPPPDTDELAEVGLRAWVRIRPDVPFMGLAVGRYLEVAKKLGIDPMKDAAMKLAAPPGYGKGKRMPLATAGLECYAFLGSSCGEEGAHLNEDYAIVQAVDPATGREVADGEWGTLVVTTLGRDNPLVRYDLEEACALTRAPCSCGETTIRGFWGGRFADLIQSQGKHFQPAELEAALRRVREVTEPTLEWVVVRPADEAAPLRLRVELAEGDAAETARRCADAIRDAMDLRAEVEIVAREVLPRSGFKAKRIVDA